MANIRSIKKEIDNKIYEVLSDCFTFQGKEKGYTKNQSKKIKIALIITTIMALEPFKYFAARI